MPGVSCARRSQLWHVQCACISDACMTMTKLMSWGRGCHVSNVDHAGSKLLEYLACHDVWMVVRWNEDGAGLSLYLFAHGFPGSHVHLAEDELAAGAFKVGSNGRNLALQAGWSQITASDDALGAAQLHARHAKKRVAMHTERAAQALLCCTCFTIQCRECSARGTVHSTLLCSTMLTEQSCLHQAYRL